VREELNIPAASMVVKKNLLSLEKINGKGTHKQFLEVLHA
jgi:hypothetical protein